MIEVDLPGVKPAKEPGQRMYEEDERRMPTIKSAKFGAAIEYKKVEWRDLSSLMKDIWARRETCQCHKCQSFRREFWKGVFLPTMSLCEVCGNKRCPKATDHAQECTNSNEPGQKGSAYE